MEIWPVVKMHVKQGAEVPWPVVASLNNSLSKTLNILPLVNVFDTSAGFIDSDYFQPADRKMKAQFNSPWKWTTNESSATHQLEM